MADHPRRLEKKRPPHNAVEERLSKLPYIKTPEIEGAPAEPPGEREPSRLTRRNLRLHNKMNKGAKGATSASEEPSSKSNKTISTTASDFESRAIKNGLLHPLRSMAPNNAQERHERQKRRRDSTSPTESEFRTYRRKLRSAGNERGIIRVMDPLFNTYHDEYNVNAGRTLSALPPNLGFNNGLSAPKPDFIEGLSQEEYLPFDPSVIPGAVLFEDATSITLPHLAGEWKADDGSMKLATLQSAYDGAIMVYGKNQAQAYLGDNLDPPENSTITTFATDGEQVTFYAHHALPTGEDGKVQYHQHFLGREEFTGSYEGFKAARRQIRNAQDYAREQSFALRDRLLEHRRVQRSRGPPAPGTPAPAATLLDVDMNEDGMTDAD